MTQKFPLLFAPFRLCKHGLRSRIIVTGHAGKRTKLGYRVLKPASSPLPLCRVANFHTHVSTPATLMPAASTMSLLPVISSDRSGCVQVIDRTVGAAPPGSVGGIDRLFYEDRFG